MPYRAHEVKKPHFQHRLRGGGTNGNSVGLETGKMHFGMSQRLVDEN